nr:MAG: RNA-dependent RNA polymerase [Mitovirus sp.]
MLRKLHLRLFELLETFKQDRTFTQDPYIPRRLGHKYHSLDLSAATDRFPLKLQKELIAKLISGPYAEGWEEVLVGTPFITPEGDSVVYNAGQPMGAYSSWATFAVAHHMVIDYAAFKEGLDPQSDFYILLGDDVVINHDGVADRYRNIMSSLGVDISPLKTHVSYTTYEFAKRWFHYGKEITGIQLAGFMHILESGLNIPSYYCYVMPTSWSWYTISNGSEYPGSGVSLVQVPRI